MIFVFLLSLQMIPLPQTYIPSRDKTPLVNMVQIICPFLITKRKQVEKYLFFRYLSSYEYSHRVPHSII